MGVAHGHIIGRMASPEHAGVDKSPTLHNLPSARHTSCVSPTTQPSWIAAICNFEKRGSHVLHPRTGWRDVSEGTLVGAGPGHPRDHPILDNEHLIDRVAPVGKCSVNVSM
jgi:hypothetical protein